MTATSTTAAVRTIAGDAGPAEQDATAREMRLLLADLPDAALEAAAVMAAGIPTASINLIPPNCC